MASRFEFYLALARESDVPADQLIKFAKTSLQAETEQIRIESERRQNDEKFRLEVLEREAQLQEKK